MRTTKIWNISLPPDMAEAAEKTAREECRTKSELVREALRQYIWGRKWRELRMYGEKKARRKGLAEEEVQDLVHEARRKRR